MAQYRKHEDSHEKFLKDADDFCVFTIRMLKSEAICPKSARWLGADEIIRITHRIHTQLHRANNMKVTTREEKNCRHAAQADAYALLVTLGEKFTFCAKLYNVEVDKLSSWLTRKGKVQAWLSSWIRSDENRYKNIG